MIVFGPINLLCRTILNFKEKLCAQKYLQEINFDNLREINPYQIHEIKFARKWSGVVTL